MATQNPLGMMENAFYFTLKAFFVLKKFIFVSWPFDHVEKQLDSKEKVNFNIYDVTTCKINNFNKHIAQYLKN